MRSSAPHCARWTWSRRAELPAKAHGGAMDRLYRWPDDYQPLDGGRLLVRPDFAATFAFLGLGTSAAVMATDRCVVIRRVGRRDNCRMVLPGPEGKSTQAFLKRHFSAVVGDRGP